MGDSINRTVGKDYINRTEKTAVIFMKQLRFSVVQRYSESFIWLLTWCNLYVTIQMVYGGIQWTGKQKNWRYL